jgi:hypothetical protein
VLTSGVTEEPMNRHGNRIPDGTTGSGAQGKINPDGAPEVGLDAAQEPKRWEQDRQAECAKRNHDQRPTQEGRHATKRLWMSIIGGNFIQMLQLHKINFSASENTRILNIKSCVHCTHGGVLARAVII